VFVDIVELLT